MAIIKWLDSFNTGIDQFDKEHRKIIDLINTMYESVRYKKSKDGSFGVIDELISYTLYHFQNEERWMDLHKYPELKIHIEEHDSLKRSVEQFKEALEADFEKNHVDFYHFLRDWLMNHIKVTDKKLGIYLLNEG